MPLVSVNVFTIFSDPTPEAVAFAGEDQSILCASFVTLQGEITFLPGDSIDNHTFEWEQDAGDIVTLINPNTLTPSFVADPLALNDYAFTLYVDRGTPLEVSDQVIITRTPTTTITGALGAGVFGSNAGTTANWAPSASASAMQADLLTDVDLKATSYPYNYPPDSTYSPIYKAEDLRRIKNNLAGKYWLMRDVDMSELDYPWEPLGTPQRPFSGELQGNGFSIQNLTIDGGTIPAGLFSYIGNGAVIKQVGLTNANISGVGSGVYKGILAGSAQGPSTDDGGAVTVRDVYVTGDLNSGGGNAGGLIGHTGTNVSTTIENTYADVNVTEVGADPLFSQVQFLASFDGADFQTTYTEQSQNALAATFSGTQLRTNTFNSTPSSLANDSGSDQTTFPNDAALQLGSGDFCIELFFYANAIPTSGTRLMVGHYGATNGNRPWAIFMTGPNQFNIRFNSATAATVQPSNLAIISDATSFDFSGNTITKTGGTSFVDLGFFGDTGITVTDANNPANNGTYIIANSGVAADTLTLTTSPFTADTGDTSAVVGTAIPRSQWLHIVLERSGNDWYLGYNGNREHVGTSGLVGAMETSDAVFTFGGSFTAGAISFWNGRFDDTRITIGSTRYDLANNETYDIPETPFAAADVSANVAGWAGNFQTEGTYNDNYWNTSKIAQGTGTGGDTPLAGEVDALTTAQLQVQSNFTNWDFDTVWQMPELKDNIGPAELQNDIYDRIANGLGTQLTTGRQQAISWQSVPTRSSTSNTFLRFEGVIVEERDPTTGGWGNTRFIPREQQSAIMTPGRRHRAFTVFTKLVDYNYKKSFGREVTYLVPNTVVPKTATDNAVFAGGSSAVQLLVPGSAAITSNVSITITNPKRITLLTEDTILMASPGEEGYTSGVTVNRYIGAAQTEQDLTTMTSPGQAGYVEAVAITRYAGASIGS
jgi:hypothetical protein